MSLVPKEKRQALEQAISKAQEAISQVGANPEDALKNNGVTTDFLKQIKQNLNTPLANSILSGMSIDSKTAESALDDLISGKKSAPVAELPPYSQPRVNYGNVITQEQKNELMNKLRRGLKNF